ncbi:DUF624 domain-containing protein [Sediminibacillus dalangtanensis]|uniref:DUF624 domain-containing protein n=1 Tax=Sediminibacillus dalangtanensis TaxID=2729421 RepID=A0ABX7VY12_9BACI|nr:DUF624 domain-containing protein [Sediminibacillus dalangtanensis]QTN00454.1 DUF624 domain-containing protein [Sediminibacillus dalangtanensis]
MAMQRTQSIFNRIMDIFTHFLLLNVMWLVCCLPVITIFPATTAMFAVVRQWHLKGIDSGVFQIYISKFRENFRKSFVIGLLWLAGGAILYFDASILLIYSFPGSSILFTMTMFLAILYGITMPNLFLMLVNYELTILHAMKNALLLSISKILHTLSYATILVAGVAIVYYFPFFLFIIGSLLAFIMYHIFDKLTIQIKNQTTNKERPNDNIIGDSPPLK